MNSKHIKKDKVLIVINSLWNSINFRENLIFELSNLYNVVLVASKDINFKSNRFKIIDLNFNSRGMNLFREFITFIKLFKIIKTENPNIILSFTIKPNIYASLVAKILDVPIINNVTGLGMYYSKNFLVKFIINFIYIIALKKSKIIYFQNLRDRNYFADKKILKNQISKILPGSGIDLRKFFPRKNLKANNKKIIFLMISRLLWAKGVKEYFEVAQIVKRQYKNVEFHLYGFIEKVKSKDAISYKQIMDWNRTGAIKYYGPTNKVIDVLLKSDCIVLPTIYNEGVPRILLEASALKKPCITNNIPGCLTLLKIIIMVFCVILMTKMIYTLI